MKKNIWNAQTLLILGGLITLLAGAAAFLYFERLTDKPIYLFTLIAVAVVIVFIGVIYLYLLSKGKIQQTGPDYRALLFIGFMFFIFGSMENPAFYAIGLVFVIISLANRKKWKPEVSWSDMPKSQKNFKIAALVILSLLVVGGFVMWYLGEQNKDKVSQVTNFEECVAAGNPVMESYPRQCRHKDKTFVEIISQTFNDNALGVSFKYPVRLGQANITIADPGKRPGGETGRKLVGIFSQFQGLQFGGITDDFAAGRSGLITDTRGFIEENGKYFFKFVSGKNYKDYEIIPLKVLEKDFGKIIILDDQSFRAEREGAEGPVFGLGEGNLAGLINLKGEEFPGLVFYNTKTEEFSLEEFEALLDSISVYIPKDITADEKSQISKEEALKIAMDTKECSMTGILSDRVSYNSNSKTWWIDLDRMPELEKDGCSPACVVSEETKSAEVNWRCTGLTKPAVTACAPEQRNADFCTTDYSPVCAKVNIQCITTPCNPVNETFSNACEACKNPLVESYTAGECK